MNKLLPILILLPRMAVAGIALLSALPAVAQQGLLNDTVGSRPSLVSSHAQVLPVESAFPLQVLAMTDDTLLLQWQINPGHYLYRKSLKILDGDSTALALPELPQSKTIIDEFFGEVEVYYEQLTFSLPLANFDAQSGNDAGELELTVEFQGCAEATYCYPPHRQAFVIALP